MVVAVQRQRSRRLRSGLVSVGLIVAVGLSAVLIDAAPASAHGAGGLQPSNYVTTVRGITPPIPGVRVRAVDLGTKLELRNTGTQTVTVLGYDGEPYLRIGPAGVFENTRSPAVFLNRAATIIGAVPKSYDSKAAPRWRKLSSGDVVRWHDHRSHWMGSEDPPIVANDRSRPHDVLPDWKVPLTVADAPATIAGDARWIPPPSPWFWLLGAVAIAALVILLGRTRFWPRVLAIALAVLLVSEAVHLFGGWDASTSSLPSKLGAGMYSIAGWVIGLVALIWLLRRNPRDATPVVLIAALFLFIAGGLADVTSLTRSQLPSTLEPWVARLTVVLALGLGFGMMVTAALRLRPPPRRTARPAARRAPAEALSP